MISYIHSDLIWPLRNAFGGRKIMHTWEFGLFWPHFSKGDSNGGKCNKIVLRALYQPILLRLSWKSRKKDLRLHLFSLKTCLQKLSIVSLELLNDRSISTKTFLRWRHKNKTENLSYLYAKKIIFMNDKSKNHWLSTEMQKTYLWSIFDIANKINIFLS